jgi:hypothetical protein
LTKTFNVSLNTDGVNQGEASNWVEELANIYADMQIENIKVSGNKLSFSVGFSGMDDTQRDDIKMRVEEYMTMNEIFDIDTTQIIIDHL